MADMSNAELNAITTDFLLADGKKAMDIYFETSYFMKHFMEQGKGLFKRPSGGHQIKVPMRYDGAEGGFYYRNETLSEDERDNITNAYFGWRHAFGNATIYRADELENNGEYAEVEYVTDKIQTAMEECRDRIANQIYSSGGDSSKNLTGLLSLVSTSGDVTYGNIAENNLVAADGTKPWKGNLTTTTEGLSYTVLQTLRSTAKTKGKRPDLMLTTETLYNKMAGLLQLQQRFTKAENVTKAGFIGLEIDGATLVVDDFCPSGYLFALTTSHIGFAVHKRGYFKSTPWGPLASSAQGRTMKNLWDGNIICNNRKAHAAHSNLS